MSDGNPPSTERLQMRRMTSRIQSLWHHLASSLPLIYQCTPLPARYHKGGSGDIFTVWHNVEQRDLMHARTRCGGSPLPPSTGSQAVPGHRYWSGTTGHSSCAVKGRESVGAGTGEPKLGQVGWVSITSHFPCFQFALMPAIPEVYRYHYL